MQTRDGTQWTTRAQVAGNSERQRWIPFDAAVTTSQVRLVVSATQTQNGDYSRVAERTP
ncbi:hypothetical protein ACFYXS_04685 [Streptomyces sp. NPDC002574]|uniref:hypothetical protein n=1 Tax=Streptomyces sp. NPDC002574 TaxID=3364652 RepID=UPI003691808E